MLPIKRKLREKKMNLTVFNAKKEVIQGYTSLVAAGVIIPLFCCGVILPNSASAMQTATTEATLGVTLSAEQDDNVFLSSEIPPDSAKEDDLIFHLMPTLDVTHFLGDHNLTANLKGDFRKGADIVDGEVNLEAGVGAEFNFAGGLMIGLSNTYKNEQFDQGLYAETGVTDSQTNTYGVTTGYNFGERTSVRAGYSHKWEEYDDQPVKSVYDTDKVNGRITIPIATEWQSYLDGQFSTIESDEISIRNNDKSRAVIGFRWEGPNRFSYWIEGGIGEVDYENDALEDYSEGVGEIGVEVALSAWSSLQAAIGQNSYGKFRYEGVFRHNFSDKVELTFGANQDTLSSYSTTSSDKTYDVTSFRLGLNTTFLNRVEAGLTGSYQIQDTANSVETLIGRFTLDYPIQDWIKAGAHYQYATRTADNAGEEYDDNRIGLFVTLSL